jgi:hypothetical protein
MAEIITMDNISLPATAFTPEVDFDFTAHRFVLKGESYPENAAAFYRPLLTAIEDWFKNSQNRKQTLSLFVALVYFNSSSTKMLFSLLQLFNSAAEADWPTELHWYYDAEDDISEEFGQELKHDFPALNVQLHQDLNAC